MHLSRTFAIVAGAVILSAPVLSSCGFDDATDRMYTPGASTNNRDKTVDVLGAAIVTARPGTGTFIAGLSNPSDEPITLTSITGEGVRIPGFETVEVEADDGYVDLREANVHLTGDVRAGAMVPMTLEFDNGETVKITVPTVTNCGDFEDMDTSEPNSTAAQADEYSCEYPTPVGGSEEH